METVKNKDTDLGYESISKEAQAAVYPVRLGWRTDAFYAALNKLDPRVWSESVLAPEHTLRALTYFAPADTKVVIMGQDIYHTPGKANGLAFGLSDEWTSKSKNQSSYDASYSSIFHEVKRATGQTIIDASLEAWAKQGVLLLNTRLSARAGEPMSHANMGWEEVVDELVRNALWSAPNAVWFCWGREAKPYALRARAAGRRVLDCNHPSPLSAARGPKPFTGCGHFAQVPEIVWGAVVPKEKQ